MDSTVVTTLDHVRFLARRFTKDQVDCAAALILLELGIPSHFDGFDYLAEIITLYVEDPLQVMMKGLYMVVAKRHSKEPDPRLIEQSIRHAIKIAWKTRNQDVWLLYYPMLEQTQKRPSNTQFIAQIARILRLWKGCCRTNDIRSSGEEVTLWR